ncbi:DoxX family protein [Bremerella sp. T1]|uniref:DoxX family protein n=1 Tax=Bremerella sp. TYQ1 TaxID=3119568 RepID=UPI001CCD8365|nr:DoxX family protein [Bremerella volcania]UBM37521.1 DoxX family protein [Bremerella volcania]
MILIVLRCVTGWHFFMEGSKKVQSGDFSSAGFLRNAKGPLAENFRGMAFDLYGTQRLDKKNIAVRAAGYRDLAINTFGADVTTQAQKALDRYLKRIEYYFEDNAEDIDEYFNELQVYVKKRENESYRGVPHYEDRLAEKDQELYKDLSKWTGDIAKFEADYIDDLNTIGQSATQSSARVSQVNPNQGPIDQIVTWVLFISGILLILGLFTRLAALAVAGFLLQVMLAQWPFAHGADLTYVYYQSVEFVSLLLIAAIGAGRFAGLDFILWNSFSKCCSRGASNKGE